MFHRLIRALGYDADLVLAQISIPDGHQALQVLLDDARYLVDVGTGSPIFRPVPLTGQTEFQHAGLTYRFRADDEPGHWRQERLIDGDWMLSCRYDLGPLDLDRQDTAYQHHQTPGATWVLDKIRLIRCEDDAIYSLTGTELTTITPAGKRTDHAHRPRRLHPPRRRTLPPPAISPSPKQPTPAPISSRLGCGWRGKA